MEQNVKEKVLAFMEELSDSKIEQVLEFIEFLQQRENKEKKINTNLDLQNDPLFEFIGSISHGSLAADIDEELYGE